MIRILDVMIVRAFLRAFLAFVLGSPVLFVLGDINENLDTYLSRELAWTEVGQAYLFMLPKFILWSFPIAALVATVFTIHSMTMHREIVAAKAGGVSFHRLIVPIALVGVVLTLVALALGEAVPATNRRAAEILQERESRREWRASFVYQGEDGQNLSVRRLSVGNRRITGVLMEIGQPGAVTPDMHLIADRAMHSDAHGWTFYEGFLRLLSPEGERGTFYFDRYRTRHLTESPEQLLEEPRDHEEMRYAEIRHLANVIERSGGDPKELRVNAEQKLAIPVATLIIILFGAPLATSSKRGGTAYGIGISLISTMLLILLLKIFGAFGSAGVLPPLAAAWLPNALFFTTGLVLLFRVRT
jgi:lipopolysaccharide export system permease protein